MSKKMISRRQLLGIGSFSMLAYCGFSKSLPAMPVANPNFRSLSFYNLHTTERLETVYWAEGSYIHESLKEINRILRDYRTGDIYEIEPRLLDTLCLLRARLETTEPLQLISGYRSPATNAMLRREGHGVAEHSLHVQGMAADIRVAGRSLSAVRKAAIALQAGGVGFYPLSDFVHVDVGRIRTW